VTFNETHTLFTKGVKWVIGVKRVIEGERFCSLTSAQLGARADWMEAAAAAAGCPGGVPERALAEGGEAPEDETCACRRQSGASGMSKNERGDTTGSAEWCIDGTR
jgi:hypothetical protein